VPSIGQDEKGSHIEVLDTVANLGPIQDFCVVDLERQGQGQVPAGIESRNIRDAT
jgi:hypothetical protein